MNSLIMTLATVMGSILLLGLIIRFQSESLIHRKRYIQVLFDLNTKVFKLVEAGEKAIEESIKKHNAKDAATPEDLENVLMLASLANIIAEINKECIRTKMNIFFRENNPEARCKKHYAKYLEVLNKAHEKFSGYMVA